MGQCKCRNNQPIIKPEEETTFENTASTPSVLPGDTLQYVLLGGIVIIIILIINKKY